MGRSRRALPLAQRSWVAVRSRAQGGHVAPALSQRSTSDAHAVSGDVRISGGRHVPGGASRPPEGDEIKPAWGTPAALRSLSVGGDGLLAGAGRGLPLPGANLASVRLLVNDKLPPGAARWSHSGGSNEHPSANETSTASGQSEDSLGGTKSEVASDAEVAPDGPASLTDSEREMMRQRMKARSGSAEEGPPASVAVELSSNGAHAVKHPDPSEPEKGPGSEGTHQQETSNAEVIASGIKNVADAAPQDESLMGIQGPFGQRLKAGSGAGRGALPRRTGLSPEPTDTLAGVSGLTAGPEAAGRFLDSLSQVRLSTRKFLQLEKEPKTRAEGEGMGVQSRQGVGRGRVLGYTQVRRQHPVGEPHGRESGGFGVAVFDKGAVGQFADASKTDAAPDSPPHAVADITGASADNSRDVVVATDDVLVESTDDKNVMEAGAKMAEGPGASGLQGQHSSADAGKDAMDTVDGTPVTVVAAAGTVDGTVGAVDGAAVARAGGTGQLGDKERKAGPSIQGDTPKPALTQEDAIAAALAVMGGNAQARRQVGWGSASADARTQALHSRGHPQWLTSNQDKAVQRAMVALGGNGAISGEAEGESSRAPPEEALPQSEDTPVGPTSPMRPTIQSKAAPYRRRDAPAKLSLAEATQAAMEALFPAGGSALRGTGRGSQPQAQPQSQSETKSQSQPRFQSQSQSQPWSPRRTSSAARTPGAPSGQGRPRSAGAGAGAGARKDRQDSALGIGIRAAARKRQEGGKVGGRIIPQVEKDIMAKEFSPEEELELARFLTEADEMEAMDKLTHRYCLLEFEPEYHMPCLGLNPELEDRPRETLEEHLAGGAKEELMNMLGLESEEEKAVFQDELDALMERAPALEQLVSRYAGPQQLTANQANSQLAEIAGFLPANKVDSGVVEFTQRALLTLQNNPSWPMDKKKLMLRSIVHTLSRSTQF